MQRRRRGVCRLLGVYRLRGGAGGVACVACGGSKRRRLFSIHLLDWSIVTSFFVLLIPSLAK